MDKFSEFVFRTRGLYMFLALALSAGMKFYSGGTTPLLLFVVGLTIAIIVQAFRMYAASYLWGKQAVTEIGADFLCTSGPYAYVRNPLYLGNFLIGIGLCMAISEWYAYALFISSYVFVYSIVIPYEGKFLQKRFGDLYTQYKDHTGRLIPKLDSYKGIVKVIPNYKAGILGEIHVPIVLAIISTALYLMFVR